MAGVEGKSKSLAARSVSKGDVGTSAGTVRRGKVRMQAVVPAME